MKSLNLFQIKEIKEFSQESNQVDDQEDAESNEEDATYNSETTTSQSDDDSDADDDGIDDFFRPGGRENIRKLRAIRDDDDGTRQLFRHYLLWMALTAGGESCDENYLEGISLNLI